MGVPNAERHVLDAGPFALDTRADNHRVRERVHEAMSKHSPRSRSSLSGRAIVVHTITVHNIGLMTLLM
jgi:hypothetical protein